MKPSVGIKNAVILFGKTLYGELTEDHPTNPQLVKGSNIKTSSVMSGSVEQGMVETRNTIYIIQPKS